MTRVGYVFDNANPHSGEQHRCIATAHDPMTTERHAAIGVGDGWRCLDVGTGGGTIARWLADRVAPTGSVLATDVTPVDVGGHPNLTAMVHDITTDGTISEIARGEYIPAEERVVAELKQMNKPFVVLLNSVNPGAAETQDLRAQLEEKYGVSCLAVNCAQLSQSDIELVLRTVLYEFPAKEFRYTLPSWVNALESDNAIRGQIYDTIYQCTGNISRMRDVQLAMAELSECEYISDFIITAMNLGEGSVEINVMVEDALYYNILSSRSGIPIKDQADFLPLLCELASIREEYGRISSALEQVRQTGYGIVMPARSEMTLEEPEIVRQGGRFGVRLKASAPSIHMIRADIKTEVSPIVGSEKQSEELVHYLLSEFEDSPDKIWESNIFGKSLHELVNEGLNNKLYKMPEEARSKIQETLQRIVNENSSGLICIIL